jgi:sialate O-acetylesterase
MVLQRDKALHFWGWARPGELVALEWSTARGSVEAHARADENGAWRLVLDAQPAGGPHRLVFRASETIVLDDVWVGEVWLASGQSNMEWTVSQSAFAEEELALADEPRLRCLYVERSADPWQPRQEARASWRVVTPDTAMRITAVGFAFARRLARELDVAVGLIDASWGGTPVEAWTSADALAKVMDLEAERAGLREEARDLERQREAHAELLRAWEKRYLVKDENNDGEAKGWHLSDPPWGPETLPVPMLWQRHGLAINGAVWFRRDVELPEDWASPSRLCLGRIDDFDHTYVNGVLVGKNPQGTPLSCDVVRTYEVPPGVLVPGRNTISVRIFDHAGEGGFIDVARCLYLESANGARLQLAGDWQYRIERAVPLVPNTVWRHMPQPPRILRPQLLPAALFNGMIAPLVPFALRGVIWYQGESNVAAHASYLERFSALIRDWQGRFGAREAQVPFYFVQLAAFRETGDWAYLREAQARALELPDTGMVVTLDIGDARDIHPRNKREVGSRLARLALRQTYGRDVGPVRGPWPSQIEVQPGRLVVRYDGAPLSTTDGSDQPLGFEVESSDGKRRSVAARLAGTEVHLTLPSSDQPRRLLYAFCDVPDINLVGETGLPAEPFRWELA